MAEDEVGAVGFGQDPVAEDRRPRGDQRQFARVAVVDVRRPDPREQGLAAGRRWLDGLYLDVPEEWDDPYRFFRW